MIPQLLQSFCICAAEPSCSSPLQVSYEDVERLRQLAVFQRTRIPHFMRDQERYLQHLDHIIAVNELDDSALQHLLPWRSCTTWIKRKTWTMLVHRLSCGCAPYHLKHLVLSMLYSGDFCKTWMIRNKRDVHTNTSIYFFTFVLCMFVWLFHRAEYSSSAPCPPFAFTPIWSYLNTATLRCNLHYIRI